MGKEQELNYRSSLLSKEELLEVLKKIIEDSGLTDLGKATYQYMFELLTWSNSNPPAVFASSLIEAKVNIQELLTKINLPIGYITGGIEPGLHHILVFQAESIFYHSNIIQIGAKIIGIEDSSYIISKGRRPLFSLQERVSLCCYLAPSDSVVFVIPSRPDDFSMDLYYDGLAQYLNLWTNPQIIYLGSVDDSPQIKAAHSRRACSPHHVIFVSCGEPPWHLSNFMI